MGKQRELNMAKISASIVEEDTSDSEEAIGREPSTTKEINNLRRAKEIAVSPVVKDKLQSEINDAESRKIEQNNRKREEFATIQKARGARNTAVNTASAIKGSIDNTAQTVSNAISDTSSAIATVSTPGGIFLPVIILLTSFFLLLPVNGHTRVEWLWMALTGKAQIITGSGGSFDPSGKSTSSTSVSTSQTPNLLVTPSYTNPYIGRKTL